MFEARYHRFSSIRSMSLLSEKLYGPLEVKHAIYIMFSIVFGWRGLSMNNASVVIFALVVAFTGLLSAFLGTKSMSFEAKILMTFYSIFDSMFLSGSGSSTGKENKIKQVKEKKIAVQLLAITIPLCSFAIYIAIASHIPTIHKVVVVLAAILLMVMPAVEVAGVRR